MILIYEQVEFKVKGVKQKKGSHLIKATIHNKFYQITQVPNNSGTNNLALTFMKQKLQEIQKPKETIAMSAIQ